MDVGEFHGRRLYAGLRLDYRLRRWAPTSASHTISAVAELLVVIVFNILQPSQLVARVIVNNLLTY